MEEENTNVITAFSPDLLVSPHILPLMMELFAGDRHQVFSQQEQLISHLTTCHYCRTAILVLLSYAQEYDRMNNNPEEPTHDLLKRFAEISCAIDAREDRELEHLAAYAEAILAEGPEKAAQRFQDVAAHVNICADCRSLLDATVASLSSGRKS